MKLKYNSFKEYLKHEYKGAYAATDVIIRYNNGRKNGIVLIERKNFPYGISLPGGMHERMTFAENAIKEAKEETGLNVKIDNPLQPLCVLSDINQDPREFIASITYTGEGKGRLKPHKDEDAKSAAVYTLEEIAEMLNKPVWAFPHHTKILKIYLEEVKNGRKIWQKQEFIRKINHIY